MRVLAIVFFYSWLQIPVKKSLFPLFQQKLAISLRNLCQSWKACFECAVRDHARLKQEPVGTPSVPRIPTPPPTLWRSPSFDDLWWPWIWVNLKISKSWHTFSIGSTYIPNLKSIRWILSKKVGGTRFCLQTDDRRRTTDDRRRTDRQTVKLKPIYPPTTSLCGGYNYLSIDIFVISLAHIFTNLWLFQI